MKKFASSTEFIDYLKFKYPLMYDESFNLIKIDSGWWNIVLKLCDVIQHHIDWRNSLHNRLLLENPHGLNLPDIVPQVKIIDIDGKFGSLYFLYEGGDSEISGMCRIAEVWSRHTCEICGNAGKLRVNGIARTYCDQHESEYQRRIDKDNVHETAH